MPDLQKQILCWYDLYGRKDLPWQHNKTPYRVWVSEIMLQQTQVSTVIPYYHRFIARFPDVSSLATAKIDEVLHYWTGLGYYTRARNLHRTAIMIKQDFQEQFPNNLEDLQTLPGIGRSTAGAILALAFQKKAAILDGNVKRVLTRLYGITEWPGEKKTTEQLWDIAEKLTPTQRVADYTQAIMDLGATLCTRGKPRCETCPLIKNCLARQQGIEQTLPCPKPRKTLSSRQVLFLLLHYQHSVLLEKRPSPGIWGGLWSVPEVAGQPSLPDIQKICQQRFQLHPKAIHLGERFRHTFSHFHLDILPAHIVLNKIPLKVMDSDQQIWYKLHESQAIGLPAPVKKLLRNLS